VLLCSGKIYYDLNQHRESEGRRDVTIHRLEQYYPFRPELLEKRLQPLPQGTPVVWVQEEPLNMGAWPFLRLQLGETLFGRFPFSVVAREASASPASGSATAHRQEQKRLLTEAFGDRSPRQSKPDRGRPKKERKHGR
jgi:2-oxoglutarate dehydrogenase E1 component